jgi:hypothetical protein
LGVQDGTSELTPDESTMWGVHYNSLNSLAACPNSTRDFAPSAQGASTPFPAKAHYFVDSFQDQGDPKNRAFLYFIIFLYIFIYIYIFSFRWYCAPR